MLLSGGGDSVCLLDVRRAARAPQVSALHVNYGLREGADARRGALPRRSASALGVPLCGRAGRRCRPRATSRRARATRATRSPSGCADGRLRGRPHGLRPGRDGALPAGGLARARGRCSGWRRAAGGWCGRCCEVTREEVRDVLPRARARVARGPLERRPPLRARARAPRRARRRCASCRPAAERTIAETARQLRDEAEVLDAAVDDGARGARRRAGGVGSRAAASCRRPSRAARAAPAGRGAPAARRSRARRPTRILALGGRRDEGARPRRRPAGGGRVRDAALHRAPRTPSRPRRSSCRCRAARASATGRSRRAWRAPGDVAVDATSAPPLTVRAWRDGDRMRPVGLGGTKTLQDLFTDRKVPRALRRTLPGGGGGRRDRLGGRRGGGRALRRPRGRPGGGRVSARAV